MSWFRRRRADGRDSTRVFFTTDIHGSDVCWRKFVNAGNAYKADALVLGGDLTGKMMVPIIREDGGWTAELFGEVRTAESEAELEAIERAIRTNGFYAYRTTAEEADELRDDPERVNEIFLELMRESISAWVELADERLRGTDVACYVQLGNDDPQELAALFERSEAITYVDGKVVRLDERHELASCGYANMTPWKLPRDLPEEELWQKLEDVVSQVRDVETAIFNFHAPPRDSTLDTAPELTEDLRPVLVGGQPNITGVGSSAVREVIERYQPLVSVHGHIHESRGAVQIGRTTCINPGSEYGEGILHGVLLTLRDGKLLSHQFVAG